MNMLKRDINFFSVIGQDSSGFAIDFEKWVKISLVIFGVIAAVIIGVMVMINGALTLRKNGLEKDIAALEDKLKEVEALKQEAEQLQMDIDIFKQSVAEFDTQARLTTEDIEKIAVCIPASVKLTSFGYSGDTVTLSCTGDSELAIADFANSLRNSQVANPNPTSDNDLYIKDFDDVTYTGVSKGGDNQFSSSITIKLKSREPVEVEEPAAEEGAEGEEGEEGENS